MTIFNARSSVWWAGDKTAINRTQFESLRTVHRFHKLISQPTHLLLQTLTYHPPLTYENIFGTKIHTRKSSRIRKGFELYQVFMHDFQ